MGIVLMARKKEPQPAPFVADTRKAIAVTLKASPEWKAWIEDVARFCRLDVAKLIDRAVIDYAKAEGFPGEAPER